jgi:hypothetical protein
MFTSFHGVAGLWINIMIHLHNDAKDFRNEVKRGIIKRGCTVEYWAVVKRQHYIS